MLWFLGKVNNPFIVQSHSLPWLDKNWHKDYEMHTSKLEYPPTFHAHIPVPISTKNLSNH